MEQLESHKHFGGLQEVWKHTSPVTQGDMRLGVFLPPKALRGEKCAVLYWLSGLTCTEQNFITKSMVQAHAAQYDLIVVAPDTSPRGEQVPNDAAYDLGQGAGFYIDATQSPWKTHFQMETYIVEELASLIEAHFPCTAQRGIAGHSMGGHGALSLALKYPEKYVSVSAFAPITAPSQVPWGKKVFAAYLGADETEWKRHDTCELLKSGKKLPTPILVHQGGGDEFLSNQLRPELLKEACIQIGQDLDLRIEDGYDHSYYFVSSFIGEHIQHHARYLYA